MLITLDIKVIPRSRRRAVKADAQYDVRCYVISPPEDNKANKEVIAFLADCLGVAQRAITLIAGETSRIKRISIEGFATKQAVLDALNLERQHALF